MESNILLNARSRSNHYYGDFIGKYMGITLIGNENFSPCTRKMPSWRKPGLADSRFVIHVLIIPLMIFLSF